MKMRMLLLVAMLVGLGSEVRAQAEAITAETLGIKILATPKDAGSVVMFVTSNENEGLLIAYTVASGAMECVSRWPQKGKLDPSGNKNLSGADVLRCSTDGRFLVGLFEESLEAPQMIIRDLSKGSERVVPLPGEETGHLVISGDQAFITSHMLPVWDGPPPASIHLKPNQEIFPEPTLVQIELESGNPIVRRLPGCNSPAEVSDVETSASDSEGVYFAFYSLEHSWDGYYRFDHPTEKFERVRYPKTSLSYDNRYVCYDTFSQAIIGIAFEPNVWYRSYIRMLKESKDIRKIARLSFKQTSGASYLGVSPNGRAFLWRNTSEGAAYLLTLREVSETYWLDLKTGKNTTLFRTCPQDRAMRFVGWGDPTTYAQSPSQGSSSEMTPDGVGLENLSTQSATRATTATGMGNDTTTAVEGGSDDTSAPLASKPTQAAGDQTVALQSARMLQQITANAADITAYRARCKTKALDPNGGFNALEETITYQRPSQLHIDRTVISAHNADAKGSRVTIVVDGESATSEFRRPTLGEAERKKQETEFRKMMERAGDGKRSATEIDQIVAEHAQALDRPSIQRVNFKQVEAQTSSTVADYLATSNHLLDPFGMFTTDTLTLAEETETQWIINAEYRPNYAFWTGARLTIDKPTGSLRKIEVDDPRSGGRMAILEVTEFEVLDQAEPALFHYAPPANANVRDATGEFIEQVRMRGE